MPWQPLPRIAFAVATYPFAASHAADLPLEIGDELYIIEETSNGDWLRGYLVAPPSLLAGLTSVKGQTLEARVFSGIFPRSCVEIRELLGEADAPAADEDGLGTTDVLGHNGSGPTKSGAEQTKQTTGSRRATKPCNTQENENGARGSISVRNDDRGQLSTLVQRGGSGPKPPAPVPMLKIGDETPTSVSEPLIDEIASCLREWHSTNLHELLLSRQYAKLDKVWQLVCALNSARQQFLHNVLTTREYKQLREKTVWDLVRVNKLCGGEVIVRDPAQRGRVLTGDDSVIELTTLQSTMSLLDEVPLPIAESTALHHLLMDVKGFAGASSDSTTLLFYLASRSGGGPITQLSENYLVEIPAGGRMGHLTRNTLMRTLFVDLSPSDVGDAPSAADLFLVVKVHATQPVVAAKPGSRSGSIKRDTGAHATSKTKDQSQPPLTSGNKSMRRSLMWAGKSTRQAFSRGHSRLDPLDEHGEPKRPPTGPLESRDGQDYPPGTAGSKATVASVEGQHHGQGLVQGSHPTALRTVGVGVLSLNSIVQDGGDVEHVVSIWSPTARWCPDRSEDGKGHGSRSGMTDEWDPVLKDIMDSRTGQYEKSRRAERLQLQLRAFNHPDADVLIKATPTVLSNICKTNKIGFAGAPTKPRSDIYITLDEAMLSRHTLLSRFGGSPASLAPSFHGSNLQVTLEVRKSTGERVENCIYASSNTDAVSTWHTVAVARGEPWRQTIRLLLPPQEVAGTHLALHVADIPDHPFAFAYMPLWDEQAFIKDGPHALLLYRCEENATTPPAAQSGPFGKQGGYLGAPWTLRGKSDQQADVTGPLAMLRIQTYLCSTRFSQDQVMLGLLKWRECPKEQVAELLKQMMFVAEIEVVKMLNDVLDSLFSILVEYQGKDEYEDLVFTALVRVLDIVHDRRFNLAPLVDQYAENRFNYPFATPCLVRSFTRLLSNPSEPDTARKLRATFKVVRHILKFITHARVQQKEKEVGIGISGTTPGFTRHIRAIFKALDAMMRSSAPVLVGSQTLAVQHFHTWLPELAGLLSTEEILHIAIDFVDSCANVTGKLILYKLVLIINYSRLDIFGHPEQRSALSANTIRWIAPHWGAPAETDTMEQWKDQVRLCCSILASQVDYLGPEIPDHMPKIIESYLAIQASPRKQKKRLSLLFPTTYPFPSKPVTAEGGACFDEALMELSAVLSALSSSSTGMQLEVVDDDLGVVVENTLRVHMSILQGEAFPADWLSVQIFHHKSTMRMLRYLAETILLDSFLPDPDRAENFNTELWKMFFMTLLQLVGSPSLALETFPEQKRRAVWKIAGDVREDGADLLRRTWEAIGWETSEDESRRYHLAKMGGYQVQYVPTLVGPIVELCLSVHQGLRRMAVEVLQTMMVSEWTLSEDLSVIQTEMIDCLDTYFKTKPLTESILQKLFVKELLDRFEPLARTPNEPMYTALRGLMATVTEFLDLLVAVHSGDGGVGEATNLIHRLRLMEFLRDMQKEEIFVRYVHQLATLQADARNHAEAGLALRLHADLYEWDPTKSVAATADPPFPSQSHFERKERIYFEMIKHFEDGEAWTSALDAYKELHVQYETNIFDFAKLARTERAMATIHETLTRSDKLIPKYFRVVYKGLGFPTSLRDKQFIFQGSPAERTSAFIDRMQAQYPAAHIVANDKIDDVEGQFLVISAISPHRNLSHPIFRRPRVPLAIRDHVLSSQPQLFSVTTRRSTSGPVAQHHAEKTVYTTNDPFPTILRRSEIVSVRHVRLSAKETALERIVRKTAEMTAVEKKLSEGEDQMAQLLVDAVKISVNPESENSVAIYRQLLPRTTSSPDVDATGDDTQLDGRQDPRPFEVPLDEQETAIKTALADHALMIKRCIATFSKFNDQSKAALPVQDLEKDFESTFAPEIATFSPPRPVVATSPAPSWPRSLPSTTFTPALQQGPLPTSHSRPVVGNDAAATAETAVLEEVSVVHPVKLHAGRSTRLSFLSGRKKDASEVPRQHMSPLPFTDGHHLHHSSMNGTHSLVNTRGHEVNTGHSRGSILLDTSSDPTSQPPHPPSEPNGDEPGWTAVPLPESASTTTGTNTGRPSWDIGSRDNKLPVVTTQEQAAGGNKGTTVKKRFSMLKLGKKSSKASVLMGSLEEE